MLFSIHEKLVSKSMKNILIIAPFTLLTGEKGNHRFRYLAELLAEKNNVTLVTSNFLHSTKRFRNNSEEFNNTKYKIVIVNETGYKKNVGMQRIYSHWIFRRNLLKFLNNADCQYDYIYCAYPMMGSAHAAGEFARKNKIPFVLDVQDIWPDAFKFYFKRFGILTDLALFPCKVFADIIYGKANYLVAVSDTYLQRAQKVNQITKKSICVYIGVDLSNFDRHFNNENKVVPRVDDVLTCVYIGALSHSYDIETVIKAVKVAEDKGINIRFLVLGDGPLKNRFHQLATSLNAPVEFFGYLSYENMCSVLSVSDVAINAINKGASQSITNKIGDFLASGLAMLNSSENKEFVSMVNRHVFGLRADAKLISHS
jgi:glycosyltransferase involved in cell wall biosynthesis